MGRHHGSRSDVTVSRRRRRAARGPVAAIAVTVLLVAGLASPALAGGVVGDPQPELAHFSVGATGGTGTGAVVADGDLVLAAPSTSGTAIEVCVLRPGARACTSRATLQAFHHAGDPQDSFGGTVEVLATGGEDVSIVALDCCYIGADGAVVFDSTDGGRTFAGMKEAGDIATIGAATYAGGSLVVGSFEQGGLEVQALAPDPSSAQTSYAVPVGGEDGETSLATYHGGVLVANDNLKNTYVEYAKSGSGLNTSSSYKRVGTFGNELVTGISGDALLTDPGGSLTGGERLRFFNGTSFGPPRKVPDSRAGDDGYFSVQEVGTTVHVFFLGRRDGYNLFEDTTTDGVHWTQHEFSSLIGSSSLSPVLGPTGAGLLFANDGTPLLAQPILNAQGVHVALSPARVRAGHAAVLRGTATPRLGGQVVTLEALHGSAWFGVKSTHESATGAFAFSVAGATATYRAVVNLKPGYYQYGYSNAATLTAVA